LLGPTLDFVTSSNAFASLLTITLGVECGVPRTVAGRVLPLMGLVALQSILSAEAARALGSLLHRDFPVSRGARVASPRRRPPSSYESGFILS
jgi:hypothetical protein